MGGIFYSLRFLRVLALVPGLMVGAFGATVLVSGAAIAVDSRLAARALEPVLLLQLFAVSSGFVGPARRGHYDLLLTSGCGRLRIAFVHWILSASPGLLAWLMVASIERLLTGGASGASLSGGTVVAFSVVSVVAWAVTVPLPRLTGGIGWLAAGSLAALAIPGEPLSPGLAALIRPWALLGRSIAPSDWILLGPVLAAEMSSMALAFVWIRRVELPLEAAQ